MGTRHRQSEHAVRGLPQGVREQLTPWGNIQTLYAIVVIGSLVAIVPIMILFLVLQRYWQQGLSLGSIRG